MRIPLTYRILAVQLLFAAAAAAVVYVVFRDAYDRSAREWVRKVETLPAEKLYEAFAGEIGRSLLLRIETPPEVQDRDQARITEGVNAILREIPSIKSVLILDRKHRIRYANDSRVLDLAFTGPEASAYFDSEEVQRRPKVGDAEGETETEVMYPIFDTAPNGSRGRRLGSLVVVYRPDAALAARIPPLTNVGFDPRPVLTPLAIGVVVVIAGWLVISTLAVLPVRKLDRAFAEFRERGFRGEIDVERLGLGGELASTVRTINEMGGRLEALDVRGREREALLSTLFRSLEDGMIALDPSGTPVAWNDAAMRMLGVERRIRSEALAAGGEGETAFREALRQRLQRCGLGSAEHRIGTRDTEIEHGDGMRVPVQVTGVPLEAGPGRSGTLLLLRDLATLRLVETHLLEAGRFAVLANLAGSLAHEIRNPLHSIGLNAGVVGQYVRRPATEAGRKAMDESVQTIQEETRRLTDLLNNYLGLLRSTPEPGPVDVREVCRRVIQLLSHAAMKSRVEIRLEGEDDVPTVHGMTDRLQQAVLNLVLNAIQAMPQGGSVVLKVSSSSNMVRLTVQDTGPGLPEGIADHLFDSKVTTKPGGSGLGLPLVKMIAEAHGGTVWYRSDPGKGAAFILMLPGARQAVA